MFELLNVGVIVRVSYNWRWSERISVSQTNVIFRSNLICVY